MNNWVFSEQSYSVCLIFKAMETSIIFSVAISNDHDFKSMNLIVLPLGSGTTASAPVLLSFDINLQSFKMTRAAILK